MSNSIFVMHVIIESIWFEWTQKCHLPDGYNVNINHRQPYIEVTVTMGPHHNIIYKKKLEVKSFFFDAFPLYTCYTFNLYLFACFTWNWMCRQSNWISAEKKMDVFRQELSKNQIYQVFLFHRCLWIVSILFLDRTQTGFMHVENIDITLKLIWFWDININSQIFS